MSNLKATFRDPSTGSHQDFDKDDLQNPYNKEALDKYLKLFIDSTKYNIETEFVTLTNTYNEVFPVAIEPSKTALQSAYGIDADSGIQKAYADLKNYLFSWTSAINIDTFIAEVDLRYTEWKSKSGVFITAVEVAKKALLTNKLSNSSGDDVLVKVLGKNAGGEIKEAAAGDLGKNSANSNLTTTGARIFNQQHTMTKETNGFPNYVKGVVDKVSDAAFSEMVLKNPTTGEEAKGKITTSITRAFNSVPLEEKISFSESIGLNTVRKTINANVVLDNSYHNAFVMITANCSIAIPAGLRLDFNCVFDVVGIFTATFTASGTTLSAPFGTKLKDNESGTVYCTSLNNYRLKGNFTTT